MIASRGTTFAIAALACALCTSAHAQQAKFVKEFIYPTAYDVRPVYAIRNGVSVPVGTVVTPTDFVTREVGVILNVAEVSVMRLSELADAETALEQLDAHRNTPLMIAAAAGDAAGVRRLLNFGASVNARNDSGSTALMGAAAGGNAGIVSMLLRHRALVNLSSEKGYTPLMFAVKNGHAGVVDLLIRQGASVNAADRMGHTALMYAVDGGHADIAQSLLEKGAAPNRQDRQGVSPLRLAKAVQDEDFVLLLTRHGAVR